MKKKLLAIIPLFVVVFAEPGCGGRFEAGAGRSTRQLKLDDAEAYYNRGITKGKKGDHDGAIEDFTTATRLKPGFVEAYYNRGVAKGKKCDLDGAIEDYTKAISLKPDYAEAYFNGGLAKALLKGDLDGAIDDFTNAIRLKDVCLFANAGRHR